MQSARISTPRGEIDLAYRRRGAGASVRLLLLHGIGSNSRSFASQLDGLGLTFDVVAWDAPGYGASADPPSDYSMADFADAAAGLLDALDWQHAHVLGHSFGGVVAQVLYQRHPERVESLILADTNTGASEARERTERRLADVRSLTPRELAQRRAPQLVTPDAPADLIQDIVDVMAQIRPIGYSAAAVALGNTDTRPWLGVIRVPTLVIHGARDTVVPPAIGAALANAIPNARIVLVEAVGHASNQQAPNAYNAAIRDFIVANQTSSDPPPAKTSQ